MSRSTASLWGQMSRAVELHLAGHDDAAFDALFAGLDCPYDVCAMACGLANAIAVHVPRPEGTQLVTKVVGETPDTDQEDVDVATLAAAVIAAVGNDDIRGAVLAWGDAAPMVRSRALWHLLLFLSTTLRDRQS